MQYHFIGIGGIGMSGLARLLLGDKSNLPHSISGSDLRPSAVTAALEEAGASIYYGHSASHVPPNSTVVYSGDIKTDNPEYAAALSMKCKMLHRADLLALLMETKKALIVAGTHGKTTTTSLLAWTLLQTGQEPSYAIGGILATLRTNAAAGKGPFFVAEADESDGTFLKYKPFGAIVTNIDLDHMNHYVTEDALVDAFKKVMHGVKESKHHFWCGDDSRLAALAIPGVSYGFSTDCDLVITRYEQKEWVLTIDLALKGKKYLDIQLPLVGRHNALNAAAVFGLSLSLGLDEQAVRSAFRTFAGVHRRCEKRDTVHGALILDDYAHHPTEIKTTLSGIRAVIGDRRLIAVYQPHRYTRVRDCLGTFADVFSDVTELVITDIYSAGEPAIAGITHQNIIDEIAKNVPLRHIPRQRLAQELLHLLKAGDLVVGLGAGDITHLAAEMKAIAEEQ